MVGFLKKLFSSDDASEEILQGVIERGKKWEGLGVDLARDCKINGLDKGDIVRLSEMLVVIDKHYSYNSGAVESGFLDQMKLYVDSGEIIHFNTENKDLVFIHKKYASEVLSK